MYKIHEQKPQCGGDENEGQYDLPLHIAALFLVLTGSMFGCAFPLVAKKIKWLRIPNRVFFICKHFGTGVLVATAFVHLLPTAFNNLSNPCLPDLFTEKYPPMPGAIVMFSLVSLFTIELWLNSKTGGHSHCHRMSKYQQSPDMSERLSESSTQVLLESDRGSSASEKPTRIATPSQAQDTESQQVDSLLYKRLSLNITLLEGGILFHSVFVGMTLSITTSGFLVLLIAILFHQLFEGLGLGSRIAAVPYPPRSLRPWLLVVAFGTTTPIGQAIGLGARNSYDPESAFGLIIVGVFNAISAGLLIYAATVDLLAEDFLSEEGRRMTKGQKIGAFCLVLAGAASMSVVGAFA